MNETDTWAWKKSLVISECFFFKEKFNYNNDNYTFYHYFHYRDHRLHTAKPTISEIRAALKSLLNILWNLLNTIVVDIARRPNKWYACSLNLLVKHAYLFFLYISSMQTMQILALHESTTFTESKKMWMFSFH